MKKSEQKLIFSITLSIILIIGASNKMFAQNEVLPPVSKFLILVETTDNEIKLTGSQGCAFKELSFSLKTDKTQAIDQYGMSSLERAKTMKDDNLANFLFTIKKSKDGLSLEGIEGTIWKNLSFSCSKKCYQAIDQNGVVIRSRCFFGWKNKSKK